MDKNTTYFVPVEESQLRKIYEHFDTTAEILDELVDSLIKYLETRPHLIAITDRHLLKNIILRADMSLELAHYYLEHYFASENLLSHILQRRDPLSPDIQKFVLSPTYIIIAPKLTYEGDLIIFAGRGTEEASVDSRLRFITALIDIAVVKGPIFRKLILIVDAELVKVSLNYAIDFLMRVLTYFKLWHKPNVNKIYVINFKKKYTYLINIAKMFLHVTFKRLEIWDKPANELSTVIDKECLPVEYGGTLESYINLKDNLYKYMCEHRDEFLSGKLSGIADVYLFSSDIETNTVNNAAFGVHGSATSHKENQRKWITEMMTEAELKFDMTKDVVSEDCWNGYKLYKQFVSNQTIWAVRMKESTEWPKLGIFAGITSHYGYFEECLRAQGPNISGQYCLVNLHYDFNFVSDNVTDDEGRNWPAENASAWEYVQRFELDEAYRISRQDLTWAMCIPSSCSWQDLNRAVDEVIKPIFYSQGLNIITKVAPRNCRIEGLEKPPLSYYLVKYLFCTYFMIVILATVYSEFYFNQKSNVNDQRLVKNIFKHLSLVDNYRKLTEFKVDSPYHILNLIKTVVTIISLTAHSLLFYLLFPKFGQEEVETIPILAYKFVLISTMELFFFFFGFFALFNRKWLNTTMKGFLKDKFITALSIFVVLFVWMLWLRFIYPYAGDGPMWRTKNLPLNLNLCSWITTLTFTNNILHCPGCLRTDWTIMAHLQILLMFGSLFVIFKKKWQRWFVLAFLYVVSVTYTYNAILRHNLYSINSASPRIDFETDMFVKGSLEFRLFYSNPIAKIASFVIGCVTVLIMQMNKKKQTSDFSKLQLYLKGLFLYISIWGFMACTIYNLTCSNSVNVKFRSIFMSIYGSIFLIPVIYTTYNLYKYDGHHYFGKIFNLKWTTALARLCKSISIVSFGYQAYIKKTRYKITSEFSSLDIVAITISDITISIIIAFIWYLFVEKPIYNIIEVQKIFPYRDKQPQVKTD